MILDFRPGHNQRGLCPIFCEPSTGEATERRYEKTLMKKNPSFCSRTFLVQKFSSHKKQV